MEAKRRIHKFNFDQDTMLSGKPVHVALVDQAANLTEVVTMKAATYTTHSSRSETYNDDGTMESISNVVSITDHGDEHVRVVEEVISVREQYVKVR